MTCLPFTLLCLSIVSSAHAAFHVRSNGDIVLYDIRLQTFDLAQEACSSVNGSLPVIKTSEDRLFFAYLIEGITGFWVNAEYFQRSFRWSSDKTPVYDKNTMIANTKEVGCSDGCCRLELQHTSHLVSFPCSSDHQAGLVCVVSKRSEGQTRGRRRDWYTSMEMDDKLKQLEGNFLNYQIQTNIKLKEMQKQIKTLNISSIVLLSLVVLALILIVLLAVGLFIIYKKGRAFIIGKIRDILKSLGERVDGMNRRLERSLS